MFHTLSFGNAGHVVPGRSKPVPAGGGEFVAGARSVVDVGGGAGTTVVVVGAVDTDVVVGAADVDVVAETLALCPVEPCGSEDRVGRVPGNNEPTDVDVGAAAARRATDGVVHPAMASTPRTSASARDGLLPRNAEVIIVHDRSR